MAKYVIEIPENTHWIQWIMEGTKDHHPYMDWKLVEDLTPYTESDEQSVEKNAVNLCTSCKLFKEHFPECGDVNILFGDGVGNDNICCCNKYEPYTEPDRKAIEDEVWEFASMLMNMHPDVAEDIYWSMNGGKGIGVATEMTYQQAKAKYEEWRKKKDEIHVGDEVEAKPGNKACVLYENPDGTQVFVFKADGTAAWWSKCAVHKTGKNHPEVVELLKKMREE